MSRAIVDPDELRAFRGYLSNALGDMEGAASGLKSGFAELGEHWRDEKYARFSKLFEDAMKQMAGFQRECENYLRYLDQKERAIRKYLDNAGY